MGMLLDEAIDKMRDPNNEVLFVYCNGICKMCRFNTKGSRPLCRFCSKVMKKTLSVYSVNSEPLTNYYIKNDEIRFDYKTAKDLRNLTYRDVNIGLGLMSGYISTTRNLNPLIDEESRYYFDAHLQQDVDMIDAFYNLIDQFQPDVVYTFNGRYEEVRHVYDICLKCNIHLFLSEGFTKNGLWKKVMFDNHLPIDIKYRASLRDYSWEHYDLSSEEKEKLGRSFFENRRNGIYAGDKIYIKEQVKGKIPPIDKNKVNIGIMNSSEDEFCAVGAEWESLKFFPSQYEGIIYLIEHASPNIHFYLRIHPNLKDIKYKYHQDLLKLEEKYHNITVIPGNSKISTYTLLDNMDKIIVFGSTMGIESVYWGKPVILLGPALYSFDDTCYIPKDKNDLDLLLTAKLKPKFNELVLRYGAFEMNQDPVFLEEKAIDFQMHRHKFILPYHSSPFLNFWGGEKLTGFICATIRYILGTKLFNRYTIPVKEA
jgi:hypothetical protein